MAYLLKKTYRGLDLVFQLNLDRLIYLTLIALSLIAGFHFATFESQLNGFIML